MGNATVLARVLHAVLTRHLKTTNPLADPVQPINPTDFLHPMHPNFSIIQKDSVQILEISNLLSEYANKEILLAAQSKIDEGFSKFVVDLKAIDFMNSVGLNFLITLRARSDEMGGQMAIANAPSKVLQLLKMTKLLPMFQVTSSVEEALEFLAEM
jgi:anti-anti-sigma factor